MLLLASALTMIVCQRAPDYDESARTGRYELTFQAQGDFEFVIQNGGLYFERFSGPGPTGIRCTYTQQPPNRATAAPRLIAGKAKPKVIEGRVRVEKTAGPYELWLEWERSGQLYRAPRPNSVLPNPPLRRADAKPFDNAIEGRVELEATVKTETLIFLRGENVHASPPLLDARLALSQPLPQRTLQTWKIGAKDCKTHTLDEPSAENGWTAVVSVTPKKPGKCVFTASWKR